MLIWPVRLQCDACGIDGCGEVYWTGAGDAEVHTPEGWIMRARTTTDHEKAVTLVSGLLGYDDLDQRGQLLLCNSCARDTEVSGSDNPNEGLEDKPSKVAG